MGRAARILLFTVVAVVTFGLGVAGTYYILRGAAPRLPDGPIVVERLRDVARLETLDVSLHEVIHFQPDPVYSDSKLKMVFEFAKQELKLHDRGTAVVFAEAHVGFDLSKLSPENVRIQGGQVTVKLPPLSTQVELLPEQTLVVDSNLDSQQTMQLLEVAKQRFEARMLQDARIKDRARASSERALRALLITLGFQDIQFVDTLPAPLMPG